MLVDGPAATALGDLAASAGERHRETLAPPQDAGGILAGACAAALSGVEVGIARTFARLEAPGEVEEVLPAHPASIAQATRTIYLENQYFHSPLITGPGRALGEPEGPQVVLISTGRAPSWFDHLTMDRARGAIDLAAALGRVFEPASIHWPSHAQAASRRSSSHSDR